MCAMSDTNPRGATRTPAKHRGPAMGQAMKRREDPRLLTGGNQYVCDFFLPGTLEMALVRSPLAHARIRTVDVSTARALPGVVAVLTAEDLGALAGPLPEGMTDPRMTAAMPPPLADGVVRYVGEPIAVVLAESRYVAEDGVELVEVDLEPLAAVVDPAAQSDGPVLHAHMSSNLAATVTVRVGTGRDALAQADVVVHRQLRLARVAAHPLEPRGIVAAYDVTAQRLVVYAATQGVFGLRRSLARWLTWSEDRIRVVAPDVGGGFGVKNRLYAEDALAVYLAIQTGRPVKWAGDRYEEFVSTNQERDQVHEAVIGVNRDGRIVAVVDDFIQDNGAYTHSGLIVPHTTAVCIPGPYRVPHLDVVGRVVLTNKVPIGPYRGAGRPQATFVMERLLDAAADALRMDRVEIRRKNLIHPVEQPYNPGVAARDRGNPYDPGDYPACMEAALAAMPPAAPVSGLRVGTGLANYLEVSAGMGFEGARYQLMPSGRIQIASGAASQGQGHEITFAQIAADRLGAPVDLFDVVEADTGAIGRGIGTFGSRTTVMAGNAVAEGAPLFRRAILEAAAAYLEAHVDDLDWDEVMPGMTVRGVPARTLSLKSLAERLEQDGRDLVAVEHYFEGSRGAHAMGTHVVRVGVDAATGQVQLLDYVMAHDAGVVVNPLLVAGQIYGGTVQALGQALFEELVFSPDGQPLNTTFLDYSIPAATDFPRMMLVEEQQMPSVSNPEGFKGIAEGGVMPPMAAVLSAVEQALGVELNTIPITPERVWAALGNGAPAS